MRTRAPESARSARKDLQICAHQMMTGALASHALIITTTSVFRNVGSVNHATAEIRHGHTLEVTRMTATSVHQVSRFVGISLYVILIVFSIYMMAVSLRANAHLEWSWRPDNLTYTFLPWTLFLVTVLLAQFLQPRLSWSLVGQCTVVGVLLFLAFTNHALPNRSISLGGAHLAAALACSLWNIFRVTRFLVWRE